MKKDRIQLYSGRGGYNWRGRSKNGRIVSIGGESFTRKDDAIRSALRYGPRDGSGKVWPILYRGQPIEIEPKFAAGVARAG